ncbi:hydrogenase maturation nickel metallochaperone HypA [Candidatus Auribacterota bacterium]
MHEYHIVGELVNQVLDTARNNDANKVTKVSLVMGELSGFEESSVRLYFQNLTEGTLIEGAELEIKPVKASFMCKKCGKAFESEDRTFKCPGCGDPGSPTEKGKEFYIEDIEVE